MDNLQYMLDKQCLLQERLGYDFDAMDTEERVAYIKEQTIHINQEMAEMLYELPYFKPWKDYTSLTEIEKAAMISKARMECIDMWHFFMNVMMALGFSSQDFTYMFTKKNEENHRRQDEGYTADKSYKHQSVEEVMNHE